MKLMGDNKCVAGYHAGRIGECYPEMIAKPMNELIRLYKEEKIKPEIYTVLSLEEVSNYWFDATGLGPLSTTCQRPG